MNKIPLFNIYIYYFIVNWIRKMCMFVLSIEAAFLSIDWKVVLFHYNLESSLVVFSEMHTNASLRWFTPHWIVISCNGTSLDSLSFFCFSPTLEEYP